MTRTTTDRTSHQLQEKSPTIHSSLRHIPLALVIIALVSIPALLHTVNIVAEWPIEQTALSQFGWYPSTQLAFGIILSISGLLLLVYQIYLVGRYQILENPRLGIPFMTIYSLSFTGMIIAGIFPMSTPAVFTFPPDPLTLHFVASSVLIIGFPISISLFGFIVRKEYKRTSTLSFLLSFTIFLFFVFFFSVPTTRSSMLLELWSILWGLVWLNVTAAENI